MSSSAAPPKRSKWESDDDEPEQRVKKSKSKKERAKGKQAEPKPEPDAAESIAPGISIKPSLSDAEKLDIIRKYRKQTIQHRMPSLMPCRSVENYEKLNRIEEGAYGIVYRAQDRTTGEIVALKKLKLEREKNGFPVTSLREIHTLLLAKHPNIVNVREIAGGDHVDRCVYVAYPVDVKPFLTLEYLYLQSFYIVMDFIEHDLKGLMESMKSSFLQSEIKTLMLQLLSAVNLLHENFVIHRDLKTSNLLLNNRGEIKVADFGLARKFAEPTVPMTQLVVTLWYRYV